MVLKSSGPALLPAHRQCSCQHYYQWLLNTFRLTWLLQPCGAGAVLFDKQASLLAVPVQVPTTLACERTQSNENMSNVFWIGSFWVMSFSRAEWNFAVATLLNPQAYNNSVYVKGFLGNKTRRLVLSKTSFLKKVNRLKFSTYWSQIRLSLPFIGPAVWALTVK